MRKLFSKPYPFAHKRLILPYFDGKTWMWSSQYTGELTDLNISNLIYLIKDLF